MSKVYVLVSHGNEEIYRTSDIENARERMATMNCERYERCVQCSEFRECPLDNLVDMLCIEV